ncbi:translin isoform X1 [Hydra vulgaris]|uniref:translin isoform X1 n=1 Tax=Hydra vulgaris TaxID=6087 RepID=UPI0032EA4FE9
MDLEENQSQMFSSIYKYFEEEKKVIENIKSITTQLNQKTTEIIVFIQDVHCNATNQGIKDICELIQNRILETPAYIKTLSTIVPHREYYRFHHHWKNIFQKIVFACAFCEYFQCGKLISNQKVAEIMQICNQEDSNGFHLDLDDYLIGVLEMAIYIFFFQSRLSVNNVIAGNYEQPVKIGKFLCELDRAFRLLHLKNDAVRKRFDVLKYDLKKVEQVVYDLRIRGLLNQANS